VEGRAITVNDCQPLLVGRVVRAEIYFRLRTSICELPETNNSCEGIEKPAQEITYLRDKNLRV
jgi:hypothetical protein